MTKEIYREKTQEFSVKVVNSSVNSIREKEIQKLGVRIYKDNKLGIAGTLGNEKISKLVEQAKQALKYKIPYPYEASKDLKMEINENKFNMSKEKMVLEVEELLEYLRGHHNDFIFSGDEKLIKGETSLKNDRQLNLEYSESIISISLLIKEKASANLIDGWAGYVGRKYNRKKVFSFFDEFCNTYNNKVDIERGKRYPVIFVDSQDIIFQKLTSDLNGLLYGTKASLLKDKLGEKVFSHNFTLYHSLNPKEHFTPFFDMEGVVNKGFKYKLIDKGIFRSPYTDKKTSAMFNLPLTGSAAGSYDGIPSLGNINFEIKPTKRTLKELIGGNKAIFVVIASGGDSTPEGNFSYPLQLSFLYENGKLVGRLPELNISSNVFEMFGDAFVGVSKDRYFDLSPEHATVIDMIVD